MPDPEPPIDIVIILDKPCWERPISEWEALIQPAVLEALRQAQWVCPAEINFLLTDDARIQELNKNYRDVNKPTNVLSFPSLEPEEISDLKEKEKSLQPIILGDVVLSFEIIRQESLNQEIPFDHHLIHLAVHGVLHLLGFDHERDEDATVMESLEIKILSSLTIPNPY